MRLSELLKQGKSGNSPGSTDHGTIRSAVTYQRPIDALYHGKPVRLIACGDITGMSPCEKFVDEDGNLDWAPSGEFVINDGNVVPQSDNQRQRLTSRSQGDRSSGSSTSSTSTR